MAQELLYLDQVLEGFPDNVSSLIEPVNIRNLVVSTMAGKAFLENTDNVTLLIDSGVWLLINPLLVNAAHTQTLWSFDGNNFLHPSYATDMQNTTVPSPYYKLASLVAVLELTKDSGGADNFEVQFTKNTVGIGEPESVEFAESGTQTLTLLHSFVPDISIESDTYGVRIEGVGTSDDLTLGFFSMQISDSVLLSDPTP